jgi:hypothetical protein
MRLWRRAHGSGNDLLKLRRKGEARKGDAARFAATELELCSSFGFVRTSWLVLSFTQASIQVGQDGILRRIGSPPAKESTRD